jgi:hypothetical protein
MGNGVSQKRFAFVPSEPFEIAPAGCNAYLRFHDTNTVFYGIKGKTAVCGSQTPGTQCDVVFRNPETETLRIEVQYFSKKPTDRFEQLRQKQFHNCAGTSGTIVTIPITIESFADAQEHRIEVSYKRAHKPTRRIYWRFVA